MPNASLKKKTQKVVAQKERAQRSIWQSQGIPEFMIRLAREQHLKIFPELALPKNRHD